jgi:hypothetical protein
MTAQIRAGVAPISIGVEGPQSPRVLRHRRSSDGDQGHEHESHRNPCGNYPVGKPNQAGHHGGIAEDAPSPSRRQEHAKAVPKKKSKERVSKQ